MVAALSATGCGLWGRIPNPLRAGDPQTLAPESPARPWQPGPAGDTAPVTTALTAPQNGSRSTSEERDRAYDLPALIDLGLGENPDTRNAWEAARTAAARYGGSLEPYFPRLSANAVVSPNERILFQDTPETLVIHQDTYEPQVVLTYTLLDFGRRAADAELTRQRLVAANFAFDRELQRVVFEVERAYFLLDAALGLERASVQNVDLAHKVREAADQRLAVGLATRPDALLSQQVETRALYELESAHAAVRSAQANLARTLGRPATQSPRIDPIGDRPIPSELSASVESLIAGAVAERPDLAARAADVRASEAAVEREKASFWPELGFEGRYGEAFWDYTVQNSNRIRNNEPTYSTLLRFDWDIFRGFGRENAVRAATSDSERARAQLEASQLDASVEVWSAYYDNLAAARQLEFAKTLLASSEDTYQATLTSYQNGLSDIVALLTAERDLATARYTLVRSRADLLTSAARLAFAAGTIAPRPAATSPP